MKQENKIFANIEQYAKDNQVPIISKDTVEWLERFLQEKKPLNILEIGAAIGYSALVFARSCPNASIYTVERDKKRYNLALDFLEMYDEKQQIDLFYGDALSDEFLIHVEKNAPYDFIFIDAAKKQNAVFFDCFSVFLKQQGYLITDNMDFHGLSQKNDLSKLSKNLRPIVYAIQQYKNKLVENKNFQTYFMHVGDTLAISKKTKES